MKKYTRGMEDAQRVLEQVEKDKQSKAKKGGDSMGGKKGKPEIDPDLDELDEEESKQ